MNNRFGSVAPMKKESLSSKDGSPHSSLRWPIVGVVLAIAATTTMDATGLSAFSVLALLPLMLLLCYIDRLTRPDAGSRWGHRSYYGLAIAYPLLVMTAIGLIASVAGALDLSKTNWQKAGLNLAIITISTFLIAIITEEGFFRGWLWGSLRRACLKEKQILVWSSIAFALWHISAVTIAPDFKPAVSQIPIFLINAAMMGAVWGLLCANPGSIVVASFSHGLWNGMAYVLFGFGVKVGALGIANTPLFGPEIGFLGLASNALFAFALWSYLEDAHCLTGEGQHQGKSRGGGREL